MDKLATQYAEALMRLIEQGTEPQEAVTSLRAIVDRRGHKGLWPRVARAFMRLSDIRRRRSEVVLTAGQADDIDQALQEARQYIADGYTVRTAVDETLIGGWRMQAPDTVVDASYKKHLLNIFRNVTSRT